MARIRTIKPEFFTSADIVSLSPLARLFYVSLWCESDREGRLNWNVKTLKMRYFPADDCCIEQLSGELIRAGLIAIYEVGSRVYCHIPAFKIHQVINNRESDSAIPPPEDSRVKVASARVTGEGKEGREGKGREGASKFDAVAFLKSRDVDDLVIKGWLAVRKQKDAANTEIAFEAVVNQAKKAGLSLNDAIKRSVESSWAGFKAAWLEGEHPDKTPDGWVSPKTGDTRKHPVNGSSERFIEGTGWVLAA